MHGKYSRERGALIPRGSKDTLKMPGRKCQVDSRGYKRNTRVFFFRLSCGNDTAKNNKRDCSRQPAKKEKKKRKMSPRLF